MNELAQMAIDLKSKKLQLKISMARILRKVLFLCPVGLGANSDTDDIARIDVKSPIERWDGGHTIGLLELEKGIECRKDQF